MVGWWTGFPYWLSVAIIAIGGILGVMYSVPLRRALVTGSDLPFPEGVAAAEVLKVGAGVGGAEENRRGLDRHRHLQPGLGRLFHRSPRRAWWREAAERSFRVGAGATGVSASLSMALIGVGHLVGMAVGIAMIVGLVIARAWLLPWLTASAGLPAGRRGRRDRRDRVPQPGALHRRRHHRRRRDLDAAARSSARSSRAHGARSPPTARARQGRATRLPLTERDLPITIVAGTIVASLIPIALLLWAFADSGPIAASAGRSRSVCRCSTSSAPASSSPRSPATWPA